MSLRIALNGFGRIGRYVTRLLAEDNDLEIVAINARADNHDLAHLFRYDSVHGAFKGELSYDDDGLIVNGRHIKVTRDPLGAWKWKALGADVIVENTGKLKKTADLQKHIECGARRVVIAAPAEADITIVMGVNNDAYDPAKHRLISNASCTTNCLAPAVKALLDGGLSIRHGFMTTIHSYTMDQRLLDGSHKDLRRGRSAAMSMVPTSTGAAKAIGLVLPQMDGKMAGLAIRVPTPNVSLVDLVCEHDRATSKDEINEIMRKAAAGPLKGILGISDEPLVSCDFVGSSFGGVVDTDCTKVLEGNMSKLLVWYDNEAGFSHQLVRLLRLIKAKG